MTPASFSDPAQVTFDRIQKAAELIRGAVLETPCLPAPRLSQLTGAEIFVKYENMQVTGAFKERGALVKLSSLTAAEKKRGVIAVSAGNHAQGVAYHAGRLGIPATIVHARPDAFCENLRHPRLWRRGFVGRKHAGRSQGRG